MEESDSILSTYKEPVSCGQCRHFTYPEPRFERNSMGDCRLYNEWVAKWGDKIIPREADERTHQKLVDKIFFTDVERYCIKFEAK